METNAVKTSKTVNMPADLVREVERIYRIPGQNFKWDPHLLHLVQEDLKAAKVERGWGAGEGATEA